MEQPIEFFGDVVDGDAAATRTNRNAHELKLGPATPLARCIPAFGGWGSRDGFKSWPLGIAVKILGPIIQLTPQACALTILKHQVLDTAINRVVVALTAKGVFDAQCKTFDMLKVRYAEFLKSANATPQFLRDVTLDESDFFETAAPDRLPGGNAAPQWALLLTYGDGDNFGLAAGVTTAEQVMDFVYTLGPCYVEAHFAGAASVQTALKKIAEVHAADETAAEETAIAIIDSLAVCPWPPGFDSVENSLPRRRLAISARHDVRSGTPEKVRPIVAKHIVGVLSLHPTLEAGLAGAAASDAIDMVVELARAFDCSTSPLVGVFAKVERALKSEMTPPARAATESAQEWVDGITSVIKSRKRSLLDAPAGAEQKQARADGSSAAAVGVPRAFQNELHKLLDSAEWVRQVAQLVSYNDNLRAGEDGHTQTGMLEAMLTGKMPREAWPLDEDGEPTEPASNSNAKPLCIFQQFLRGKYDPAVVAPKLFFLKPICNKRTFAKLLAQVAVRLYWQCGGPIPACLQAVQLDKLADVLLGKRWKQELEFANLLHLPIVCAYNDMLPDAVFRPNADVWLINRTAETANACLQAPAPRAQPSEGWASEACASSARHRAHASDALVGRSLGSTRCLKSISRADALSLPTAAARIHQSGARPAATARQRQPSELPHLRRAGADRSSARA